MKHSLLEQKIFSIGSESEFDALSLEVFQFQYQNCLVYQKFVDTLGINPQQIVSKRQIPFLPISFFKTHKIIHRHLAEEIFFESSGKNTSHHFVARIDLYEKSFTCGFEHFYGNASQYCIFALLPSYLERKNSSLVYMVDCLIKKSDRDFGGFYLNEFEQLAHQLQKAVEQNKKIIFFGVTFALLDMAERYKISIPNALIFETGGMKGRKQELIREELHKTLCASFGVKKIYSEYGMTELLSQAYSDGKGVFRCPPWMQVLARDPNDPFSWVAHKQTGGLNVIDLANLYSCSFIATQDLGKIFEHTSFEVLGRFDDSDIRGCSLLAIH